MQSLALAWMTCAHFRIPAHPPELDLLHQLLNISCGPKPHRGFLQIIPRTMIHAPISRWEPRTYGKPHPAYRLHDQGGFLPSLARPHLLPRLLPQRGFQTCSPCFMLPRTDNESKPSRGQAPTSVPRRPHCSPLDRSSHAPSAPPPAQQEAATVLATLTAALAQKSAWQNATEPTGPSHMVATDQGTSLQNAEQTRRTTTSGGAGAAWQAGQGPFSLMGEGGTPTPPPQSHWTRAAG